jgi:O-antigen/teichoic acid export membrane protein
MAGLLVVASIGLLIDVPNQLGLTSLRRDLDYRALRLTQAACTLVTVVSSITLAVLGAGAYALVIGSNVLHGIPLGLHFLFVRKWKPPARWWRWPEWRNYERPLRFGAQVSGSAVLTAIRGMLEATVLPATVGYEALGLLNRAQVLFSTTVSRVTSVVLETVYPLLPRSAGDPEQFSRHATLFVQTMLLIAIPGAIFIGAEGPQLSRLLYGAKWIAADPLILPGTLFAWAVSTVLVFATVLQARNRLRLAFLSSVVAAALCLPAILAVTVKANITMYAWISAAGQVTAAIVALQLAAGTLEKNWFRRAVLPPLVSSTAGLAVLFMSRRWTEASRPTVQIAIGAIVFSTVLLLMMRFLFRDHLREVVSRLPASGALVALLRL